MNSFIDWRDRVGSRAEKFFKATIWEGGHVMLGINCLDPEQTQSVHAHDGADKFYFVLEGTGKFVIGEEEQEAGAGMLVIAPAAVPHGVKNVGSERLSLLVGIAPGV